MHLLARAGQSKRKLGHKKKQKNIAKCLEECESKSKKNWRKLNKRKNKKPGEKNMEFQTIVSKKQIVLLEKMQGQIRNT